ncbi:hypothetical protein [Marinicella sp. W31]|uniref:hypothetical protein n=1 Tax=Marinicella sp. W31 TaxID=3023713 RepID=UPI0037580EF5
MQTKSIQNRLDYIANLELASYNNQLENIPAEKSSRKDLVSDLNLKSANVVDGSTVSFQVGIPKQQQEDVLDSTLLAQLAANKAFDRETQTEAWYGKYREVLENVGWVVNSFGFSRLSDSGATIKLDKVALKLMGAAISGNELALLTQTLSALENMDPDSHAVTLFDGSGSNAEGGNFQISAASLDPNNDVHMSLGTFYFKATEHKARFLFVRWSSHSINIYGSAQNVTLNERIYDQVRTAVTEKLGRNALEYIAGIDI